MSSGPIVVQVLEGEDAIAKNQEVMGATNPANADDGTIRKDFGESVEANWYMVLMRRRPPLGRSRTSSRSGNRRLIGVFRTNLRKKTARLGARLSIWLMVVAA